MSDRPIAPAREPLLSDEELVRITLDDGGFAGRVAEEVRQWYEAKITSGELRVVKIIPRDQAKEHVLRCKENMADAMDTNFYIYIDWCPGCGAKITD